MEQQSFRILIIDDNKEIHHDFKKILSMNTVAENNLAALEQELFEQSEPVPEITLPNFQIDSVTQGKEGAQRIQEAIKKGYPYSLAFVDIRMPPGWDGIETIKHIWEIDKDIQIVICTAYSDYSWEDTVSELGVSDNLLILKKPFDNVSVRQLACALTKKWQLFRETRDYTGSLERRIQERTKSLEHSLSLTRSTLESAADGILVIDNDNKIIDYNHNFKNQLDIPDTILNKKSYSAFLDFIRPQLLDPENSLRKLQIGIIDNVNSESLDLVRFKDGRIFEQYSQPHKFKSKTIGRVWSFRNVTKRIELENQLEYQALHDALTGLPNRVLLTDRINHAIEVSKRNHTLLAILFFDLDRFKLINDSLTHAAGDELLKVVVNRVHTCIRTVDTFARMGGDEFVILLSDLKKMDDIHKIVQKILNVFQDPFTIQNRQFVVTTSIGICIYPNDGSEINQLLQNADLAMYLAKANGGNQYQLYTHNLSQRATHQLEQEEDLRHGIENNEFFLVYQPQINTTTNTITGVEALLRWNHPRKGLLLPLDFIPAAEETGLIVPLGEWVIEEACRQNKEWQENGYSPIRVIVNIESQILKKSGFIDFIKQTLSRTKLKAEYLEFELTETVIINNVDIVNTVLEIRALGIKLALDDFGTGNSSINYLNKLPLDKLKIDRSFIDHITTDGNDELIVKAIIAMANSLKLEVIAEGVETKNQLASLKNYSCNNIQGFYYSEPLPAEEMEQMFRTKLLKARNVVKMK